jgi:hypothetical protein
MALMNIDPERDRLLAENRARVYLGSAVRWLSLVVSHVRLGNFADAHFCHVEACCDFAIAGIYADAVPRPDASSA